MKNLELKDRQKRLWAKIDVDAIEHNFSILPKPICCVVKANAYGLGAVYLSRIYERLGASYLAVSNIEEAIQLRKNNINIPILVLGFTPPECVRDLEKFNITQTIYSLEYAKRISYECIKRRVTIICHLKIDTGMGRIGFQVHDNVDELDDALACSKLPNIQIEGIFTHFSIADEGINEFTLNQKKYFDFAVETLENKGVRFKIKHCSNSAASINYPNFKMDMIRAGIILYGINPTPISSFDLKPVLSLWSVVSNVKRVKKGDSISYGRSFVADQDMIIATIPVGYADGYSRLNSNNDVYINGERCKIVGRICMDQMMVSCENAKLGDLVEIYGPHISIEEIAASNNTIPYEVLCNIGERVPRVYCRENRIVFIDDKLIK